MPPGVHAYEHCDYLAGTRLIAGLNISKKVAIASFSTVSTLQEDRVTNSVNTASANYYQSAEEVGS